jgi:GDPmannose 4,6-dehydratase
VPKALVVGCNGQDGYYLVQQLETKGYLVAGIDRDVAKELPGGRGIDIRDASAVRYVIENLAPDEVYFLAAFHHSADDPGLDEGELVLRSFEINTLALNHVLSAIAATSRHSRLFYAASSHIFGDPPTDVQDENTPLNPVDPYGISKTAGVHLCRYYRTQRQLFCSVGILYNHESPRRHGAFVSQKVVQAAVRISHQAQDKLVVGNLDAMVDWGYAPDYVDAMWRILQLPEPDDFVIASGSLHSVRDLVQTAFEAVGLDWNAYVETNPGVTKKRYGNRLQGNSARLEAQTGWRPSMPFAEMIQAMVQAEDAKWNLTESSPPERQHCGTGAYRN